MDPDEALLIGRAAERLQGVQDGQADRPRRAAPFPEVAADRGPGGLGRDTGCLEDLALLERHTGRVLRDLDPAGRYIGVLHAGLELLDEEVGDLIDAGLVDPVGHERLTIDARDHHRGQPGTIGRVLHDIRASADAEGRGVDERIHAQRLGFFQPRPDDLVDHLRIGVDVGRGRIGSELHEHVVVSQHVADLVLRQWAGGGVEHGLVSLGCSGHDAGRQHRTAGQQGPQAQAPPARRGGLVR